MASQKQRIPRDSVYPVLAVLMLITCAMPEGSWALVRLADLEAWFGGDTIMSRKGRL